MDRMDTLQKLFLLSITFFSAKQKSCEKSIVAKLSGWKRYFYMDVSSETSW